MSELTRRVAIRAPGGDVWDVLSDWGGASIWAPTIVSSRSMTEANGGVGARREFMFDSGAKIREEVLDWDEGRGFTIEIIGGFGPIRSLREVWSLESLSADSVVVVRMDFDMRLGFFGRGLDRFFLNRIMGRQLTWNLAGLKHFVETGEAVGTDKSGLPVDAVE